MKRKLTYLALSVALSISPMTHANDMGMDMMNPAFMNPDVIYTDATQVPGYFELNPSAQQFVQTMVMSGYGTAEIVVIVNQMITAQQKGELGGSEEQPGGVTTPEVVPNVLFPYPTIKPLDFDSENQTDNSLFATGITRVSGIQGEEHANVSLEYNDHTKAAARFLDQTTYGPTAKSIKLLADKIEEVGQEEAFKAWIQDQATMPIGNYYHRFTARYAGKSLGACNWCNSWEWWKQSMLQPEQLRQRLAFVFSQIMVVSIHGYNKDGFLAGYYQILTEHSMGDFRKLLDRVTRTGPLAYYLDNLNNFAKNDPNHHVTENYARELMQLFTIGTVMLNEDGTEKKDANGKSIPSYTESDVENLSRALTGLRGGYKTMLLNFYEDARHDQKAKVLFEGQPFEVSLPAKQGTETDFRMALDAVFNHPNTPVFIPKQLIQHLVTSNPSPEYVYDIAQVFKNNGTGKRGDLGAVVQAILLHPEARTTPKAHAGLLRDPVRRITHLARAFKFNWKGVGPWRTIENVQWPLAAETVFSFYQPDDAPVGEISDNNMVAPRFKISDDNQLLTLHNTLTNLSVGGN